MIDPAFQIEVWGWCVTGPGDKVSEVAEYGESHATTMWDRPEVLDSVRLNGQRPPDWLGCYWLGEHVRRGHEVYP